MHGTLPTRINEATPASDKSVASPTNLSDEALDEWFPAAARTLLAPKPGFILDLVTGCGERNGDRYANGSVKPPGNLVRALLRSDHGAQWLAAIMDGCDATWWREHQRAERIAAQIDSLDLS